MLVLTPYDNARFKYALDVVLRNYPNEIQTTSDISLFNQGKGPRIQYGGDPSNRDGVLFIPETSWIWKNNIQHIEPGMTIWKGLAAPDFSGRNVFDIFASSFYMVTRYEEYLNHPRDHHDRFTYSSAWGNETNAIERPLVDLWRREFELELLAIFPNIQWKKNEFSVMATIDIDSAFAYRHKGLYRTVGGFAKDLSKFDLKNFVARFRVLLAGGHDPYDTYDYIEESCKHAGVKLKCFFLLADFSAEDINLPHTSKALREKIKDLNSRHVVGIHPGYASNQSREILKNEITRLQEIVGKPIETSRQHYLKMKFPETYHALIEMDIREDFTMGYADHIGFRAGTSFPFHWFDLEKNELTNLRIQPFAVMDATLNNYMKISIDESIERVEKIKQDVKLVGGQFVVLWHNETLCDQGKWRGWRKVWEKSLRSE